MPFKRKSSTRRRRRTINAAAPRRRRIGAPRKRKASRKRSSKGSALNFKPMDVVLAVGGALVANGYVDRIPIADPRYRYAAAAVGAYFLAGKVPKQFKPALLGAAIVCGGRAANAFFPDLLRLGGNGSGPASANKAGRVGRLTPAEIAQVRGGARIGAFNHPVITGGTRSIITGAPRFQSYRMGGDFQ